MLKNLRELLIVLVIGIFAMTGCESDSDSSSSGGFSIRPSAVTIPAGVETNIAFSVVGGTPPYRWSVTDLSLGTITPSGANAIYSSTTNAGENFVVVIDKNNSSITALVKHE